ncbi:hypothetical protein AI2839V1_1230 [Enterobacter cloacae]|nr:hypothetical protein AI2839V1_1230 [Enterobacter cloacae]CAH5159107.1 hypothetical protein AI2839V1_1230 [Enterobacter cloacae]
MCRINGPFLLIKINKQTTRERNNRIFAMAHTFVS